MPVQQHVLNWLYSVLTSEYHDVNRTYNDVAHVLARYSTLSPRTDVHTFPNGSSALLLHLSGTIPVSFRASTYRFPLSIWVPHAYPREAPLIYVVPTDTMMVRPGQHVDPQGQVYHPYLVGWAEFWDKSTLHDFLTILSDVFAKEPPVISNQQARSQREQRPTHTPPPLPPLPPEMAHSPVSRAQSHSAETAPPRLPPKPDQQRQQPASSQYRSDGGPPLPPLPTESPAQPRRTSRYDSAPPLPPDAQKPDQSHSYSSTQAPSTGDVSGTHSIAPGFRQHQSQYSAVPPQLSAQQFATQGQAHIQNPALAGHGQWNAKYQGHMQAQQQTVTRWQGGHQAAQFPGQATIQQPPDLMDEPLTLGLPSQTTVAAPPIPPNPEKDALLRQLGETLFRMRQQAQQQNEASLAGLRAQRKAMLAAMPVIQAETGQLAQLSNMLTSNTQILHEAMRKADGVIENSRRHPAPDIDELLVAPTVVGNQLYTLVAEERALGDAIFMLGRAVERGRISTPVFAKMTRSLAREWYFKKALVRKIGQGMGLAA